MSEDNARGGTKPSMDSRTNQQMLREMIAIIDGNRVEKGELAQSSRQCLVAFTPKTISKRRA